MKPKLIKKYFDKYVRVHWYNRGRHTVSFGYFRLRNNDIIFESDAGETIDIPLNKIKLIIETET